MKASNSFVLSAAVAGLIAGSISVATSNSASAADDVMCTNSCNGHSLGKGTEKSKSCGGTISKMMSAKACKKAGGTVKKADAAAPAAGAPAAAPAPAAGTEAPKQ